MRNNNAAPPVQFIAVAARLVNNTDTHRPSNKNKISHTHRVSDKVAPPPPPSPKTDRPSHRAPGGAKKQFIVINF